MIVQDNDGNYWLTMPRSPKPKRQHKLRYRVGWWKPTGYRNSDGSGGLRHSYKRFVTLAEAKAFYLATDTAENIEESINGEWRTHDEVKRQEGGSR